MGLIRSLARRREPARVTCVLQRESERWRVRWASSAEGPAEFLADSLSSAVQRAAADGASTHSGHPPTELEIAVYPWTPTTAAMIFDIETAGQDLLAIDARGSGTLLRGASLESLVEEAERVLSDPHQAVLRWIGPLGDPPPGAG